jgi:hypothetical protein
MSELIQKIAMSWSAIILLTVGSSFAGEGPATETALRGPPEWAYPLNRNGPPKPLPDNGELLHVPGSNVGVPVRAITDRFSAVDWHPDQHSLMPELVGHGRKPDVYACAVITPMDRGDLKTPLSRGCPQPTSSNKWKRSRGDCDAVLNPG